MATDQLPSLATDDHLMGMGQTYGRVTGVEEPGLRARVVEEYGRLASETGAEPTLVEVVVAIEGAYPSSVRQMLDELRLPYRRPSNARSRSAEYPVDLHPLDHEWYFTGPTAEELADRLPRGSTILAIGAPTVADALTRRGIYVTLVDANPYVRERFRVLRNVRTTRIERYRGEFSRFNHVIFDAPWYPEILLEWLRCAHSLSDVGTEIIFTLFPALTRPTADVERDALVSFARELGNVSLETGVLRYSTPRFEEEALRADGVVGIGEWRIGDLITLQVQTVSSRRARLARSFRSRLFRSDLDRWQRFRVGPRVIWLRGRSTHHGDPVAQSIEGCPEDVLPTVSARDPRRDRIGLWTSRNGVLSIGNRRPVGRLLSTLELGYSPEEAAMHARRTGALDETSLQRIVSLIL